MSERDWLRDLLLEIKDSVARIEENVKVDRERLKEVEDALVPITEHVAFVRTAGKITLGLLGTTGPLLGILKYLGKL